jgi:hypothetical protein
MLARIAFFHRTLATNRPPTSAGVSSTRGAAFFSAYGANSVSKLLKISSRFQLFPKNLAAGNAPAGAALRPMLEC